MSARKARTEAAAAGAAPVDSEEKDVKIPVEAVDDTEANEAEAAEAAENQVEDSNKEATMTEDEMVEAAIRAGEEAADNDFKLKFEQAQKELADVRSELDAAAEAQKAAEDKAKDATERTARLQADWENFRRRTANERIAERDRATEKLVTALLPVIDDIERAIDHARSQELADDFKQFVDGVDAVHAKLLDVFAHEGVEPIDPKGEAFDPLEHQAVGRVEDASQYDETVNDVYQKGYRMADRILRSAMVTVTYGGEKRPAPEPEAAPEDASADTAESTEAPPMLCSMKTVLVSDSVIVIISKATAIPMIMTPIVNNSFERSSSSHKIIIKRLVIRINPALIKLILFFKNQKTFSAFFKEWLSFS